MKIEPLFNEQLNNWSLPTPSRDAGKGFIEQPGKGENLRWQNRISVPGAYENSLAEAVEAAYLKGAGSADAMAAFFNERGFKSQGGTVWTTASLQAEMQRLGH